MTAPTTPTTPHSTAGLKAIADELDPLPEWAQDPVTAAMMVAAVMLAVAQLVLEILHGPELRSGLSAVVDAYYVGMTYAFGIKENSRAGGFFVSLAVFSVLYQAPLGAIAVILSTVAATGHEYLPSRD